MFGQSPRGITHPVSRVRYNDTMTDTLLSGTPEGYLTASEAAQKLGVHVETVRAWIGTGRLPHVKQSWGCKAGWRYLILITDIEAHP